MPGSSTCFLANFNNDQSFALENERLGQYLDGAVTYQVLNAALPSLLKYDPNTMAIVGVLTNFCLDDLGVGYSQSYFGRAVAGWRPCTNSTTQQFIYLPLTHQILNPNNPYHKCLYGYEPEFMALCDGGGNPGSNTMQRWSIIGACSPGEFSLIPPCSPCGPGNRRSYFNSRLILDQVPTPNRMGLRFVSRVRLVK